MTDDGTVRVVLADERALFRESAGAALDAEVGLTMLAVAADAFAAVDATRRERPDVVIVSDELAGAATPATVRELLDAAPGCGVLVLLVGEPSASHVVGLLQAGARGCVTRDASLHDLVAGVHAIVRGELALRRAMATAVVDHLIAGHSSRDAALARLARLTARERQVLAILARGGSNDTIAQELVISTQTARTHVSHLLSKLGVHSRLEAVAMIVRHGLLEQVDT